MVLQAGRRVMFNYDGRYREGVVIDVLVDNEIDALIEVSYPGGNCPVVIYESDCRALA